MFWSFVTSESWFSAFQACGNTWRERPWALLSWMCHWVSLWVQSTPRHRAIRVFFGCWADGLLECLVFFVDRACLHRFFIKVSFEGMKEICPVQVHLSCSCTCHITPFDLLIYCLFRCLRCQMIQQGWMSRKKTLKRRHKNKCCEDGCTFGFR